MRILMIGVAAVALVATGTPAFAGGGQARASKTQRTQEQMMTDVPRCTRKLGTVSANALAKRLMPAAQMMGRWGERATIWELDKSETAGRQWTCQDTDAKTVGHSVKWGRGGTRLPIH